MGIMWLSVWGIGHGVGNNGEGLVHLQLGPTPQIHLLETEDSRGRVTVGLHWPTTPTLRLLFSRD